MTTSFDEAWKLKEAKGFRYGRDALEQVRMGWEMAQKEKLRLKLTLGVSTCEKDVVIVVHQHNPDGSVTAIYTGYHKYGDTVATFNTAP